MATKTNDRQAWDSAVSTLSDCARAALGEASGYESNSKSQRTDEYADNYNKIRKDLTPQAGEEIDSLVAEDSLVAPLDPDAARYCLVECLDGEAPVFRVFANVEALVRRLSLLQGQDVFVWITYGVPVSLSKGPQRYVLVADHDIAVEIPIYQGAPIRMVPVADVVFDVEETGFLGPQHLLETAQEDDGVVAGNYAHEEAEED